MKHFIKVTAVLCSVFLMASCSAKGSSRTINGYRVHPDADLVKADFSYQDLSGVNLTGANLRRANLTGANLKNANLYRANLTEANLTGANLEGADFISVNLTGANLTGAKLTRVKLVGANFTNAIYDSTNTYVQQAQQLNETYRQIDEEIACKKANPGWPEKCTDFMGSTKTTQPSSGYTPRLCLNKKTTTFYDHNRGAQVITTCG